MVRFVLRRLGRPSLESCVGYRVDAPDGRPGVLERVERDAAGGTLLVVRRGRLLRRRVVVPAAELAAVDSAGRCLRLRG